MKVRAILRNYRMSPQKVRLVVDAVRGLNAHEALRRLEYSPKKGAHQVKKLIESALANARNNFHMSDEHLYIAEIQVNEGPIMKRWMPRAFGRATPLLKRTSHIRLILDERHEKQGKEKRPQLLKKKKRRGASLKEQVSSSEGKERHNSKKS